MSLSCFYLFIVMTLLLTFTINMEKKRPSKKNNNFFFILIRKILDKIFMPEKAEIEL